MSDDKPFRSKVRPGPAQQFAYRSFRAMVNEQLRVTDVFASCISCRHFDAPNYFCQKYTQHPPPDIIANSCIVSYEDHDVIPF